MLGWLLGLAADAAGTIAGVASAAMARIVFVWSTITGYLARVKTVVIGARAVIVSWLASHLVAMVAVMNTLQWLAFTYLPARLGALQGAVLAWAAQAVAQALAIAQAGLSALRAWAWAQLVAIAQAINALQGWAVVQFALAVSRINRLEGYVFGILSTPDRIAAYVVDAMAAALGRWARDHAVVVGRLFVTWFMSGLVGALSTMEDLITRILFD